jgi:hypothetical protein
MSEENKITTNRIEDVLLKKEKEEFVKEVRSAVHNLIKVLNTFSAEGKEETEAYQKWVTDLFEVSYRTFPQDKNIEKLPAFIEQKLLQYAVDKFIATVTETKATLDSLDY